MYRIIHSNMGVQDIILVNNRENYVLINIFFLYVYEKKNLPLYSIVNISHSLLNFKPNPPKDSYFFSASKPSNYTRDHSSICANYLYPRVEKLLNAMTLINGSTPKLATTTFISIYSSFYNLYSFCVCMLSLVYIDKAFNLPCFYLFCCFKFWPLSSVALLYLVQVGPHFPQCNGCS